MIVAERQYRMERVLGVVVAGRDSTGWSECLVWLWQGDSTGRGELHDDDLHYIVLFTSLCSVGCVW